MEYKTPGEVDDLKKDLLKIWNDKLRQAYRKGCSAESMCEQFFTLEPQQLKQAKTVDMRWSANPSEVQICMGAKVARQLSDWAVQGRQHLHNEYCEYSILRKRDQKGKMRPKRVQVTTELREYWLFLAMYEPQLLYQATTDVLGFEPDWVALYGMDEPWNLSVKQRKLAFCRQLAGHGNSREMIAEGVEMYPEGELNLHHALFMTHPINTLEDLFYLVKFGAKPYARSTTHGLEPATSEQIFRYCGSEHLGCRHADPTAVSMHSNVFYGKQVSFANPVGIYILSFADNVFYYKDRLIPKAWIRWKRGQEGMYQHLEFGPGDDEDIFLDDISINSGTTQQTLTGGYQLLQQLEVGPLVMIGDIDPIKPKDYIVLETSDAPIRCHEAKICESIQRLKMKYDEAHPLVRVAPRTMGFVD